MTKMQIIAKTMVTVLGIHTAILLLDGLRFISYSEYQFGAAVFFFTVQTIAVAIVIYFLVFNNHKLTLYIPGAGEKLDIGEQNIFLAISLRIGLVFYGLVLFGSLRNSIWEILRIFWPPNIRLWFSAIIANKEIDLTDLWTEQGINNLYNLFKLILAAYLLYGASHLVCWHIKRAIAENNHNINLGESRDE